jgi:EAL domain-containing protein (putative c-di-GMP-specific phosphodiesterase class I)
VAGIAEAGRERAFVAGMIEIARAGGAEVVAERVETEAEALLLRNMGVKYGQGWLFGRPGPLPPGKFSKILRNQRFVDTALRAPAP